MGPPAMKDRIRSTMAPRSQALLGNARLGSSASRERALEPDAKQTAGQGSELAANELHRTLDFQPANIGAGEDVSRRPGGNRKRREAEDAPGKVLPHVAFHAARACRRADHAQGQAIVARDRAG